MIKVAPSILAADFTKLGEDIESVKSADYLHFDVMDGSFVPNISFGVPVLESVRKITDMILDVHLMIDTPIRYVQKFADAGADIITFHIEAEKEEYIQKTINEINKYGKKAGISLRPDTPVQKIIPFLDSLDLILVMTVEPGYGGQKFLDEMLPKISELRSIINIRKPDCDLEVDGGINIETARICVEAGANVLVAGEDIFHSADRAAHIKELRGH
ncbi:MAG: ribulose-phosphate 3-epimerase [Oscillospiraceae bacterium]|nr:ribulose-phosphate 3-epimerase [Oscillospiraceae bacterium]